MVNVRGILSDRKITNVEAFVRTKYEFRVCACLKNYQEGYLLKFDSLNRIIDYYYFVIVLTEYT